jgi:hypothetical protein
VAGLSLISGCNLSMKQLHEQHRPFGDPTRGSLRKAVL